MARVVDSATMGQKAHITPLLENGFVQSVITGVMQRFHETIRTSLFHFLSQCRHQRCYAGQLGLCELHVAGEKKSLIIFSELHHDTLTVKSRPFSRTVWLS